jgi:hypothetical protein
MDGVQSSDLGGIRPPSSSIVLLLSDSRGFYDFVSFNLL